MKSVAAWFTAVPVCVLAVVAHAQSAFSDDFEAHAAGQLPGDAPWKEETCKSGAVITVDSQHAFSGKQALHIFNPRGAQYRRGYVVGCPLVATRSSAGSGGTQR
jgi:hypothetical protein